MQNLQQQHFKFFIYYYLFFQREKVLTFHVNHQLEKKIKLFSTAVVIGALRVKMVLNVGPKSVVALQKCIDYIEKWPFCGHFSS